MGVGAKVRHFRLPILQGLLPLDLSQVLANTIAGATLAALAIPEVMGYTRIAGTPVVTGLYTLLIPMALFALFGSSRHLVVGADSATAAIMAGGLAGLFAPNSAEWLALAGFSALLAGALLLVARLVRLGFLADFLSRTVLVGFLTGVGIQVALGEVLGLEVAGHGPVGKLMHAAEGIGQTRLPVVLVAAAVILVVVGARRISRRIPGALIAAVGAIAASWVFGLQARGVPVLGPVPSGLPRLGLPHIAWSLGLVERLSTYGDRNGGGDPGAECRDLARLRGPERRAVRREFGPGRPGVRQSGRRLLRHLRRQRQPHQDPDGRERARKQPVRPARDVPRGPARPARAHGTARLHATRRALGRGVPDRNRTDRPRRDAPHPRGAPGRVRRGGDHGRGGRPRRRRAGHPGRDGALPAGPRAPGLPPQEHRPRRWQGRAAPQARRHEGRAAAGPGGLSLQPQHVLRERGAALGRGEDAGRGTRVRSRAGSAST